MHGSAEYPFGCYHVANIKCVNESDFSCRHSLSQNLTLLFFCFLFYPLSLCVFPPTSLSLLPLFLSPSHTFRDSQRC